MGLSIVVYKASSIGKTNAPDMAIYATEECPESKTLEDARQMHDDQGRMIVDVFFESLPGGTIDAIMYHLLKRKASLFRVAF